MSRPPLASHRLLRLARWFCVMVLLAARPALAVERAFPFTWDSGTLSAGQREPHVELTERLFKSTTVSYTRTDLRLLLGMGLGERLETLFGLDADVEAIGVDAANAEARLSNVWHYSLSRATDVLGFSVAGTAALGFDAFDLEVRAIVDKQLGRVLLAANAAARRSVFWAGRSGINQRLEQTAAVRFRVNDRFSAGLEGLAREAFDGSAYQGTAFFVGPTFNYVGRRWWLSVGIVGQIAADKAKADRGNGEPLELRDNERFMVRLAVGARADAETSP